MTTLKAQLAKLADGLVVAPPSDAPDCDFAVAPADLAQAAAIMRVASEKSMRVLFWGSGAHQGYGYRVEPDIVMTTARLNRVVDWQPDDLTIVVEPGLAVADLEAMLEQRGQTAVLPETPGSATVGGVVAAALSGWRRLRYGPTRDRVLEVELVTGDGRVVRGGGRIVKNVTGYDLPRLAAGSFGALGLIGSVCLKLWPLTVERAMLEVADAAAAQQLVYRPHAIIETDDAATVYLAGTEEEIAAQAAALGGRPTPGHRWPEPLAGTVEVVLRVPASAAGQFVDQVRGAGLRFQAALGIGEVGFVMPAEDAIDLDSLRHDAEAVGGALVVARSPAGSDIDPWGTPPGSIDLQRRVKAAFDPVGIANPGILPGGI